MRRRDFLKTAAATTVITSFGNKLSRAADAPVPRRVLGRSGEKVSIVGLGGHHIGRPSLDEQESIRMIRAALDNGVNFLDNCWDYNGGVSEERMGKALRDGYRQKAFLMTKIDGQTREAASRQLEESLRRLQTDPRVLCQGGKRSGIVERNPSPLRFQRDGAIHGPGVEVRVAQQLSHAPRHAALSRPHRSVNGHDDLRHALPSPVLGLLGGSAPSDAFERLLDFAHGIAQHDRPAMRTAHWTLRARQLRQQPFHFLLV